MPRRRIRSSPDQLHLEGIDPIAAEEGWWSCRGIFAPNYLRRHLAQSQYVPSASNCASLYDRVKTRWVENYLGLCRQGEAYTRTRFLDPTLTDLGWFFIPENTLPHGPTRKRPDYCLFVDRDDEQRAAGAPNTLAVFRLSSAVLEAKKVQHPLDSASTTDTPGWFPSEQIQDYLRHAKDDAGRFFNWAILTNGNEWRLYCEQAAAQSCFVFHLAHGERFCPPEEFRLFVALFGPAGFARDPDRTCALDGFRLEARTLQEELETNLRRRIFAVLEDLAEGYFRCHRNDLHEQDLPAVYETSLIFLYRLLFVLYAESRSLLPAKRSGPGANRRYRERYSLVRLVDKLRGQGDYDDDAFFDLHAELVRLFHLINGTDRDQNEALNVTRYNGGLFDPERYPNAERWVVGDRTLAGVLRQLIFAQPPARARSPQQVMVRDDTLDYGTLEVRQLGDIYEGLLGGKLALRPEGHLELVGDDGENHQSGIFYTPDWVVEYLRREALQPLVDEVQQRADVQAALNAQSTERKQDNSFAMGVLGLRLVDPAMGSGHFLVRATEWLAEQILYHPTTRLMTEQVVANGPRARSREDILRERKIPVPPGVSQEQAETAYWRRRVVESCIYGVDTNPLAVELAKLSLWLTCIAVDEPLSFLDHHLREGNSLLGARPEEARQPAHIHTEAERQISVNVGDAITATLRDVIEANMRIEGEASTEMEVVKAKEERWKAVRGKLKPFVDALDLWMAAFDGLVVAGQTLNAYDYRLLVLDLLAPHELNDDEKQRLMALREAAAPPLAEKKGALNPFHWRIEFPAVFYLPDGTLKPREERGFDAVLGNPPYVSTHTSSEERWRSALAGRAGYLEDLYVHFTDLGFQLLRPGGTFGFIVSDTFFTLTSKAGMRALLQRYRLTHLGQCDPFNATVDAAIFVARKQLAPEDGRLLFIQARNSTAKSRPERELPLLPSPAAIPFSAGTSCPGVKHGAQGCLRVHEAPAALYRNALKGSFFEPSPPALALYRRYNEPVKALVEEWWEKIDDSARFRANLPEIREYQATLAPGDVTLVGLIAEGGQGLRTANNARFLGYLAGTPQAAEIEAKRERWTQAWLQDPQIAAAFREQLGANGGDPTRPTANVAAWEASVETLRSNRSLSRRLGFGRSDLYRVVPPQLVVSTQDFDFALRRRKQELLAHWRSEPALEGFWSQVDLVSESLEHLERLRFAPDVTDEEFCALCVQLQEWREAENARRHSTRPRQATIPYRALGLRSSENYPEPADAPRIAAIYNGFSGRAHWAPFRKGDPEGNRWVDNEPLYIDWCHDNVVWLFANSGRRAPNMPVIRNPNLYFTTGIAYTLLGNHVALKAKTQEPCVFDASASRLTPMIPQVPPLVLLALFNSDVFSFHLRKFLKNTAAFEISDLRMMPLVVPEPDQAQRLLELAEGAIQAKRAGFAQHSPSDDLVAYVRRVGNEIVESAPAYLRPTAEQVLLASADDCLATIELAVNWEAEKLYGVEGRGPFNEF
ncbi:MAG: Eco57I restriction-modification methylase domain-containing protein [Armatimonadetes bacterium]|nr:Eco57I restriction-modification methylase domain-containing protein [Armatimonadota bacterium]